MKDSDWKSLINNIKVGNCILVLGPDIATDIVDGKPKPLTEILSNAFAKEIEKKRPDDFKHINSDHLAYTADLFSEIETDDDLRGETKSFYEKRKIEVKKIYKDLAALPFQLVVNATPDTFLIQALEEAKKNYIVDHYNYNGQKRDMVQWATRDKPLIYYLFGSIDEKKSLVISEKHLFEYLVSVISNDPPIQNNISSEFRDRDKSFLFVGFGFRNWYLRILLYVLLVGSKGQRSEKSSRSFAAEQFLTKDGANLQYSCFLLRADLKVNFTDMNEEDFVSELRKKYEESVKDSPKQKSDEVINEGAPSIFICHASEDKEKAMDISENLKAGGLNPWIDHEGIRGGDKWDNLIERTIKDSDYFVILQSKAMAAKTYGYVNKEIHLALKRVDYFRGSNYIFPVIIEQLDENEKLEDFKDFQFTDLTTKSAIEELIKDIRRDFQRRNHK